jgi:hypothetical protein
MNLTSVSTISYADSNDGVFVLVGSLGRIKPEIVGPDSPRLVNFEEAFVSEQTSVTRYFARQLLNKHAKHCQNVEKITKFLLSTKLV